ncbi:starch phosphorylase [Mumia flava]|uniref:glycogen phosphorylase n=1 Tax=Mumia flava TaxID=1348852 RepID=A0A0B2B8P7_9ACTN|nr:alpha-glucan family phosphorylase [Mumia flava]PJJ53525.1 starch phosphorylase [Mumia flava]
MKAWRRFTVRPQLPEALGALAELSTNLRWSWDARTQALFARIDPEAWERTGHDPVGLLGEVGADRLAELEHDGDFRAELDATADDLRNYLAKPRWFQHQEDAGAALPDLVAYFSMEFGVTEVLPIYSGGLGILAGDHLKAASDLGVPLIGVGLLYRSGYFRQSLDRSGWQVERYPALDPQGLPLRLLADDDGPVHVDVAMPGDRTLTARVWVAQVGRVPLLLLDSDMPQNDAELRAVTDRLYGGGQDQRIRQEILAGIGGVRAVRAYTRILGTGDPTVFHMNEGHAGFLGLERVRELLSDPAVDVDLDTALAAVRASTVFTTHTPVDAGIDRFPVDLVRHYFGGPEGASTLLGGIPLERILALGAEDDPGVFNMAHMGLRLGERSNGVSRLHGHVSRAMFNGLWPGFDAEEVPIGSITNGVHAPTWAARPWFELAERIVEPEQLEEARGWERIQDVDVAELWQIRNDLRATLVEDVRARVRRSWLERGSSEAELTWVEDAFDPGALTIGFARRVPTYKRLTLMLRDPERLRAILLDEQRPVQLIVAGKAHPNDQGGKELIQQMVHFADEADVRHRIVFLPDYDMSMARELYAGCDVWLNNPQRPLEACGTSGMKSALNGGLNLSIMDGWWDEWYDGVNGWAIPTADGVADDDRRDDLEASALYDILERDVVPTFYDRDAAGVPQAWMARVRHTLETLGPKVLASRMVHDYVTTLYAPAAAAGATVRADDFAGARALADHRTKVRDAWPSVRVLNVDASGLPDTPVLGAQVTVSAQVDLDGLDPAEVVVQCVVGRADSDDVLHDPAAVSMDRTGSDGARHTYTVDVELPMAGSIGYTVRVLPHHALLATDADEGLVSYPAR